MLAATLGVFLIAVGIQKLMWFADTSITSENLAILRKTSPPLGRWYLDHFTASGMPLYARLVGLVELAGGGALVLGFRPRMAATLVCVMELSFYVASGTLSQFRFLYTSYLGAMPILGSLMALIIGGARLPWSVASRPPAALVGSERGDQDAVGLRVLSVALGVFLLSEGWPKLSWLSDSTDLARRLTEWMARASPGGLPHWYLENVAIPGVSVFAPLVTLGEMAAGIALIVGCLPRVTSWLAVFMVLNLLIADGEQILAHIVGLLVIGALLALAIGAVRLPWCIPRRDTALPVSR